jgi:crotonobetainyl-CoA:carnitine CoA-transferase CaiB-like acyl-CoA transferase
VGGVGRLIEISLRDSLIAVQAGWNAQYFVSGEQPPRTGTASPVTGPNQTFRTLDGYVNVAVVSNRHFVDCCEAIGAPDLAKDPAFASNELRVKNRKRMTERLEALFEEKATEHWLAVLSRAGVPVGRILDLPAVFADQQVLHNEMVVTSRHPKTGEIRTQGSPLRIDGRPARADSPAPYLGQHSRAILEAAGLSGEEVDGLVSAGVVVG